MQELDESDDRVRDLYKNNSKLEKKVAKLSRQLATAETAANTAANKSIAGPAVPMGPPPIPLAKPAPPPSPASTLRQPLRQGQVNVFEPTPSIGSKRGREGEVDENPMPAECIVLPPSAEKAKKHVVRTAFTPQRGGVHAFASRENNNIFANPERSNSVTKPMIKNAFARNPTSKMPPS